MKGQFKESHQRYFLCLVPVIFLTGLSLRAECRSRSAHVKISAEETIRADKALTEGDIAFGREDYYAAVIKYLAASRISRCNERTLNSLGLAYAKLGYYSEASQAFRQAIALNPNYAHAHNNLGSIYFARKSLKKAEEMFKKAIGLKPDVPSFHANLGAVYYDMRRPEKGMEELSRAVALEQTNPTSKVSLNAGPTMGSGEKNYYYARLYASRGNADKAVAMLKLAQKDGFQWMNAVNNEPDFDQIRKDKRFQSLLEAVSGDQIPEQ